MKMTIAIIVFMVVLLRVGWYFVDTTPQLPPGTVVHGPDGTTYTVR